VLAHGVVEDGWSVVVVDPLEDRARVIESVLSVSDGVIGTRGSLEEDGPASAPATFAGGVYERAADTGQALVALPSWALLELPAWLAPGDRWLDLRSGVLWRRVTTPGGALLRSARWACTARPGTEVLVVETDREVVAATAQAPALARIDRRTSLGGIVAGTVETETTATDGVAEDDRSVALVRVATFATSDDGVEAAPGVSKAHRAARRRGVLGLFEEQRAALGRRWELGDIEVVGAPELTRAARFALLQLWGAAPDRGEAAVGARGLTGPAYAGHVFWDADVFVLPVLAATRPAAARAMLEYRIRRLPAARRAAEAAGRRGARFPWESAADGTDVTPRQGVDESGRAVPIRTGELEEHITADVAWAAWQYASWTGDWAFLDGPGRDLVVDTARYWESRVRTDAAGVGHIDGVIGPDEYHEDVDDNAFTNVMAAWNLRRGAEILDRTSADDAPVAAEAARWRSVADALVTGFDPATGRHEQFAGYNRLEPLTAADLGTVPVAADLVLGRDRLVASQIVKQADLVLLHQLVPDALAPGSLERDLQHYMARTAHGSSLSPAVHALVAARAGRLAEAANLLDLAWRIDLEDLTGTAGGGLHLAALGVLGLRVQRPDDPVLWLDPRLADHWEELRVRLRWHGTGLRLRCRHDDLFVGCSAPVTIVVDGKPRVTIDPPGGVIELERRR
jgi:trehalose/maltose hydrolase-like predicted phosphorylase